MWISVGVTPTSVAAGLTLRAWPAAVVASTPTAAAMAATSATTRIPLAGTNPFRPVRTCSRPPQLSGQVFRDGISSVRGRGPTHTIKRSGARIHARPVWTKRVADGRRFPVISGQWPSAAAAIPSGGGLRRTYTLVARPATMLFSSGTPFTSRPKPHRTTPAQARSTSTKPAIGTRWKPCSRSCVSIPICRSRAPRGCPHLSRTSAHDARRGRPADWWLRIRAGDIANVG